VLAESASRVVGRVFWGATPRPPRVRSLALPDGSYA
jgi:hypothetical protein